VEQKTADPDDEQDQGEEAGQRRAFGAGPDQQCGQQEGDVGQRIQRLGLEAGTKTFAIAVDDFGPAHSQSGPFAVMMAQGSGGRWIGQPHEGDAP